MNTGNYQRATLSPATSASLSLRERSSISFREAQSYYKTSTPWKGCPKGVSKFRQAVVRKLEAEKDKLTSLSQEMFWKLVEEFATLEEQLAYYQEGGVSNVDIDGNNTL